MIETAERRLFDAYIFVDWSGRAVPSPVRPSADAIWIGEYAHGDAAPPEIYCPTRQAATDHVFEALRRHAAAERRVLVGFDFPYGYPVGLADALGLDGPEPAWSRLWAELARLVDDRPDNSNNRFEVAAALNARIGSPAPGPFWGCVVGSSARTLVPTSPVFPYVLGAGRSLARLRLTDRRVKGVQEVWKLMGAGSVGSQALLGIPRVHWLRQHPSLREISRVWPMEIGFTPTPTPTSGPFIVHAEIWPGIVDPDELRAEVAGGAIRDQAQVRLMCRWAAGLDAAGQLGLHFAGPADLDEAALQAVLDEECWILGEQMVIARARPRGIRPAKGQPARSGSRAQTIERASGPRLECHAPGERPSGVADSRARRVSVW